MISARAIELIRRRASGESLSPEQQNAALAAMYLIQQTFTPARDWETFSWGGEESFLQGTWPLVCERYEIGNGQFAHGGIKP